eukprot:761665-Hanusia_phi.AAC.3
MIKTANSLKIDCSSLIESATFSISFSLDCTDSSTSSSSCNCACVKPESSKSKFSFLTAGRKSPLVSASRCPHRNLPQEISPTRSQEASFTNAL